MWAASLPTDYTTKVVVVYYWASGVGGGPIVVWSDHPILLYYICFRVPVLILIEIAVTATSSLKVGVWERLWGLLLLLYAT